MPSENFITIAKSMFLLRILSFIFFLFLLLFALLLITVFHNFGAFMGVVITASFCLVSGILWEIFIGRKLVDVKSNKKEIIFSNKSGSQTIQLNQIDEINPEGLFSFKRLFFYHPLVTVHARMENGEKENFVFYGLTPELVDEFLLKPHHKIEVEKAQDSIRKRHSGKS